MRDMSAKQRMPRERCKVRLTAAIVKKMREDYATGNYTHQKLAEANGVSDRQVSRILSGTHWKKVG